MIIASARHILVDNEDKCLELRSQIEAGADFAQVAMENSACPSKSSGGDLGQFTQGQMVPEFDKVCFNDEINVLHIVKTQFGYHIVEVTSREEVEEPVVQTASARHILVDSEEKCLELRSQIEAGADFAQVAMENSACPSKSSGGDLGQFTQGQMVPEFDEVCFNAELNTLHIVKTQFGFHIVEVTSRS